MVQSVLAKADPADIRYDPFPYIHLTEALDRDYYEALAESYPPIEKVAGPGPYKNNAVYLMQARQVLSDEHMPAIWREFFAYHTSREFFEEVLSFWREGLAREYPNLEQRFGKPLSELTTGVRSRGKAKNPENHAFDVMMDVQFGVNSPTVEESSVRGPHVDDVHKLFAGLLYFRRPDDDSEGGHLKLYRLTTDRYHHDGRRDIANRFVEEFYEVTYRPNTLVFYLNTPRSLHGVSPRSVTDVTRRYVNFQAECYNLASGDGFFPVPRSEAGKLGSAVRRILGFKDA